MARRALKISEKKLPSEHPDVARSLNTLATLYCRHHWYGQAEPLFQRALSILEKSLGVDHPELVGILNNLAVLYGTQRRYTQAETFLRRSLDIRNKSGNLTQVRTTEKNLADLCLITGRYSEAERLLRHWLEISEKALEPNDPELAQGFKEHAFALRKMHRKSEAARSEARANAILRDNKARSRVK
jgi:tetratricopeptide (TPR) repeat protein